MNLFDTCICLTVRAAGALALVAAWHSPEPMFACLFGAAGLAALITPQWFLPAEAPPDQDSPPPPAPEPLPQPTGWTVVRPASFPRPVLAARPQASANWSSPGGGSTGSADRAMGPILSEPPHRRRSTSF